MSMIMTQYQMEMETLSMKLNDNFSISLIFDLIKIDYDVISCLLSALCMISIVTEEHKLLSFLVLALICI